MISMCFLEKSNALCRSKIVLHLSEGAAYSEISIYHSVVVNDLPSSRNFHSLSLAAPESIAKRGRADRGVNMHRQSGRNNRPIGLRAKRERSRDNGIFANSRVLRALT
jgi:hypothetical protein